MLDRYLVLFAIGIAGCAGVEPSPNSNSTTTTTSGLPTSGSADALALPPAERVEHPVVSTVAVCVDCHSTSASSNAMREPDGTPAAMVDLWKGSMMANSARDPLWRAAVSAEVATNPGLEAEIEATCMRCHAPALSVDARSRGTEPTMADLAVTDEPGALGRDGVTCTVCHQIEPEGLGQEATFSGAFDLGTDARMYGPHDDPFGMPMTQHTPHEPAVGPHILQSEVCANCHELATHTLDSSGAPTGGVFQEQSTYREWLVSDYASSQSCQDCHMPKIAATEIATNPHGGDFPAIGPRYPYGRHVLVGGNTLMPRVFAEFSEVLQPDATHEALEAVEERARDMLSQSASLSLSGSRVGDEVTVDIHVLNLAGHKLPSGIPTRRAWLEIEVLDASGARLLHSGATDDQGRLIDRTGVALPSEELGGPVRPHVSEVRTDTDVVVYEALLEDADGHPTWRLLRAARFAKDNRLLPAGFDASAPDASVVLPVGVEADPDFGPGSDRVALVLNSADTVEVAVRLRYQTLAPRFAQELYAVATPEALGLQVMVEAVGNLPETLAVAEASY